MRNVNFRSSLNFLLWAEISAYVVQFLVSSFLLFVSPIQEGLAQGSLSWFVICARAPAARAGMVWKRAPKGKNSPFVVQLIIIMHRSEGAGSTWKTGIKREELWGVSHSTQNTPPVAPGFFGRSGRRVADAPVFLLRHFF